MKITIVGMGAGALSSISYGALESIKNAKHLFLRTQRHPIVSDFDKMGISYRSFDHLYEECDDFQSVYQSIVRELLAQAKQEGEIVYAVPGHPRVAEITVELLEEEQKHNPNLQLQIVSSSSFLDETFLFLNLDPTKKGITLLDALDFDDESLYAKTDIVFTQVFNSYTASELKLRLMEHLKDEVKIILFKGVGISDLEYQISVPLYDIDKVGFEFDHLSSIFIPYQKENFRFKNLFDLMEIIKILRSDQGCPWDREQNFDTLTPFLSEEIEELTSALKNNDIDNVIEEMGDVLNLLVMLARLGEELEYFNMFDVVDGICNKLIFRHPYVFDKQKKLDLESAKLVWEQQKNKEKQNNM